MDGQRERFEAGREQVGSLAGDAVACVFSLGKLAWLGTIVEEVLAGAGRLLKGWDCNIGRLGTKRRELRLVWVVSEELGKAVDIVNFLGKIGGGSEAPADSGL